MTKKKEEKEKENREYKARIKNAFKLSISERKLSSHDSDSSE